MNRRGFFGKIAAVVAGIFGAAKLAEAAPEVAQQIKWHWDKQPWQDPKAIGSPFVTLDEPDKEELKRLYEYVWQARFSGPDNTGKLLICGPGVEIKCISVAPKEMSYEVPCDRNPGPDRPGNPG